MCILLRMSKLIPRRKANTPSSPGMVSDDQSRMTRRRQGVMTSIFTTFPFFLAIVWMHDVFGELDEHEPYTNTSSKLQEKRKKEFQNLKILFAAHMIKASMLKEDIKSSMGHVSKAYSVCPLCGFDEKLLELTKAGNRLTHHLHRFDKKKETKWLVNYAIPKSLQEACERQKRELVNILWVGVSEYTVRYEQLIKFYSRTWGCPVKMINIDRNKTKLHWFTDDLNTSVWLDIVNLDGIRNNKQLKRQTFDLIFAWAMKSIQQNLDYFPAYKYLLKEDGRLLVTTQSVATKQDAMCTDTGGMTFFEVEDSFDVHDYNEHKSVLKLLRWR